MAKPDHVAQLSRWAAGERFDIQPVLRTLPADIDPALVVPVLDAHFESYAMRFLARAQLSPPMIGAFLAAERADPNHLFMRLLLGEAPTLADWRRGIAALLGLGVTYAWGSRQRRQRFRELAGDADVLRALQGAVAHSHDVSRNMLAVLVVDGSDASYDALIPHLDAALVDKDRRLERLTELRTHAKRTPALDALFAEVDETLATRNAVSPALAVGPLIGLGHIEPLHFHAWVYANGRGQANVQIDSRTETWLRVSATPDGQRYAYCDDLHAIPHWLAARAIDWNLAWARVELTQSCLRGKKRDAVGRWLLGDER